MKRTAVAGALLVFCVSAAPAPAELERRIARLEALTERVEAISAVKRLQYAYGHYAELGLWHDFADLFADSGIGHYAQGDLNRDGIRSLFLNEVGGGRVGLADGRIYPHISMEPVVTLAPDGQSAKGRWHIMAMLGGYGTTASWAGGVYENQYVRENGVWKMKDVRYVQQYSGRYENPGWTATREPAPVHYDASLVGTLIVETRAASTEARLGLADLARRLADLRARAERLSDEIELTNLQHAYGYYVDRKMWDDVADLFAADGTMELGLQGVYVGRTSVRRGLNTVDSGDHIHLQTIVTVLPDRTARARGTELAMTGVAGGRPLWSQSIYENAFVKQNGVWKFTSIHTYPRFIFDAEKGWAKDAQPAPGPSRDFPPDRPPTEKYEIYPRFHIAPFHFDHPVTGRPPQYPEGLVGRPFQGRRGGAESPALRTRRRLAKDLESLLAQTERSIERSRAYHASENLTSAYGYSNDEISNILTLHQIVQPVIHVAADGRTANIRARLFQLGGPQGGEGSWTSGIYENTSVEANGTWKLGRLRLDDVWTAPSHGGWARARSAPTRPTPFHYKNPVSGRVPPVLLP